MTNDDYRLANAFSVFCDALHKAQDIAMASAEGSKESFEIASDIAVELVNSAAFLAAAYGMSKPQFLKTCGRIFTRNAAEIAHSEHDEGMMMQ